MRRLWSPNLLANLLASFVGQGWRALMAFLFVPFYIHILGVEAYGLIGLYTSLQLGLALLDAGLRPALSREMARFTGGGIDAHGIRTLLRSVEVPITILAATIILLMWVGSPWLATHWVHPQTLGSEVVARAFFVMGIVAAAQFVESAYASSLTGLQRQVVQNLVITLIATLRGFGSLVVLWLAPSLTAFFLWNALVAFLSLALQALAVYRILPHVEAPVGFSLVALRRVRAYAAGTLGIAVIAMLLTQSDKVLLARFMPLTEVGHYTLAAAMAAVVGMLAAPIGTSFYPRFTQHVATGENDRLTATFHTATKLTVLLVGTGTAMLALFGDRLMMLWIHDEDLVHQAVPILIPLALSALANSITAIPYLIQLSHGVTSVAFRINLAILLVYIPLLVPMVMQFGAIGAASCVLAMQLINLVLTATLTLGRFMQGEGRRWWLGDVALLLSAIFAGAWALRFVLPRFTAGPVEAGVLLVAGGSVFALGVAADPQLRAMVAQTAARLPARAGRMS